LTAQKFAPHDGSVTPEEWRDRVGRRIEERRKELRLSVRAAAIRAGFSEGQWRQMEAGRRTLEAGHFVTVNPRPDTRAAASRVLGWTDDSIDRLERGDPAAITEPADVDAAAAGAGGRVDGLRAELDQLRAMVIDIAAVVRTLAAGQRVALPPSLRPVIPGADVESTLGMAAEGSRAAPPVDRGDPTSGPQPLAEGDEERND